MSAQINLYHPRFLKQRDVLTLGNLVLAAATVYTLLAAAGGWAWQNAGVHSAAATAAETQLKAMKEQLEATNTAVASRKPSTALAAELDNAERLLRRRGDIARLLESGAVGNTGGFAEYLSGLARQVPNGLWLTGFSIDAGGNDMEIRGSMLNPAALPEYIRRLGTEKAFQGRNFAALTMDRAEPAATVRPVAQGAAAMPVPPLGPRSIDFVLLPKLAEAKGAG